MGLGREMAEEAWIDAAAHEMEIERVERELARWERMLKDQGQIMSLLDPGSVAEKVCSEYQAAITERIRQIGRILRGMR